MTHSYDTKNKIQRARPLLGTFVEITIVSEHSEEAIRAIHAAFNAVEQVQNLMSYHNDASEVSLLNRTAAQQAIPVHPWTYAVLKEALRLAHASDGLFDLTVAPTLERWGYLPHAAPGHAKKSSAHLYRHIHLLPNHEVYFSNPTVAIDLGGIAKGFAVDRAVENLKASGIESGLVNAGGDLRAFGTQSFPISIRNPRSPSTAVMKLDLKNQSLANSGNYFQNRHFCGQEVTPIVNPLKQTPCIGMQAAGVMSETCMHADALTKICMIEGLHAPAFLEKEAAAAYFISNDNRIFIQGCGHFSPLKEFAYEIS